MSEPGSAALAGCPGPGHATRWDHMNLTDEAVGKGILVGAAEVEGEQARFSDT
jgi:hypothetical protein